MRRRAKAAFREIVAVSGGRLAFLRRQADLPAADLRFGRKRRICRRHNSRLGRDSTFAGGNPRILDDDRDLPAAEAADRPNEAMRAWQIQDSLQKANEKKGRLGASARSPVVPPARLDPWPVKRCCHRHNLLFCRSRGCASGSTRCPSKAGDRAARTSVGSAVFCDVTSVESRKRFRVRHLPPGAADFGAGIRLLACREAVFSQTTRFLAATSAASDGKSGRPEPRGVWRIEPMVGPQNLYEISLADVVGVRRC